MRVSRSCRYLGGAVLLSLLLHVGVIFEEQLLALWQNGDEAPVLIRPTHKSLSAQSADVADAEAPGTKARPLIDRLTVTLAPPARPQPVAKASPAPAVRAPSPPVIRKKPVRKRPARLAPVGNPVEPVPAPPELAVQPVPTPTPTPGVAATAPPSDHPVDHPVDQEALTPAPADMAKPPAGADEAGALANETAFPTRVTIHYVVYGLFEGVQTWKRDGRHYEVELSASALGKGFRFVSRGTVSKDGLKPLEFTDFRDGSSTPKFQARFDWDAGLLHYGPPDDQKTEKLEPGAQDFNSLPFQFALVGSKMHTFEVQVTNGKSVYNKFPFEIRGETTLNVGPTEVTALVMHAENEKGKMDIWLAPQWHNLPVRIKIASEKYNPNLIATRIEINGKTVLERQDQVKRYPGGH